MLSRWLTRLRRPACRPTTCPDPARPRLYTATSLAQMAPSATHAQPTPVNGVNGTNGLSHVKKPKDRLNLFPFASRLRDGRALAQDVWSIFK